MIIRADSNAKWPLLLHGITTDTACSSPITLQSGEERTFVERGVIRRDWPPGGAVVVGSYTVWCPRARRCIEATLEHHTKIVVEERDGG